MIITSINIFSNFKHNKSSQYLNFLSIISKLYIVDYNDSQYQITKPVLHF